MKLLRMIAPFAAVLLVLLVSGCGETTIDASKVEDEVRELAEKEDVEVESVECPEDRKAEDGDEFDCDLETEDGVKFEAEVEQTSDDGDVRIRISSDELARAKGEQAEQGGQVGGETPQPSGQDAELIEQAVRSFVTAARDGEARNFCGQQTDARLARRYGSIERCVASEEATTPVPSIPDGATVNVEITDLSPPRATVRVGDPGSTYEMLDEGGEGGWAIDSIDGE